MSDIVKDGHFQERNDKEDDWQSRIFSSEPPENAVDASTITLENTLNVVKDSMWSLGDAALKSVAEVLVGFGLSPTILGYSEEDLLEEDTEENEQIPIQKDEVVSKSSFALRSEENINRRRQEEAPPPEVPETEEAYNREDLGWGMGLDDFTGDNLVFSEDKKDK